MRAKEIMIKNVVSLKPNDSIKDALAILFKMQISGLPVIDENGKLVGMFTEKEILSYILPSYIEKVGRFIYEEDSKSTKKKFQDLINLKVSQLMRKEVITVDEDTSLCEVVRLMLLEKVRRIPVLDKENKVKGIVARVDIVKVYAKEAGWQKE